MAIDPDLITTVQVSELPPAPLSNESILAHQVGDILSRATIGELVIFLQAQVSANQYEIKFVRPPGNGEDYINANFDMTPGETQGIGKVDGLWNGWAICNGNNGTDNDDGITYIGYGANYATVGQQVGEEEVSLSASEIPSGLTGTFNIQGSVADNGDVGQYFLTAPSGQYTPVKTVTVTLNGGNQAHENRQPSKVILKIMKL